MRREVRADTRGYLFRASLSQDPPVRGSCFAFCRRLVVRDRVASSCLANAQLGFLPVVQLAALTGIWGINFLIWFFPGLLSAALVRGLSVGKRVTAVAVLVLVTLLSLGYGFARLGQKA